MEIPAVVMRGGTSKGLFFLEQDLPRDRATQDAVILAAYGSPDPYRRQIDGMGGATSNTSKVAVIGAGTEAGVDVTYDFGQVSIDTSLVDRRGTCGNISAAVGPFAVDAGLVPAVEPVTRVRIWNVNTGKRIVAHVPVRGGRFDPDGDFEIPGVPGSAAAIRLDYLDPGGAVTGALLPTGRPRDVMRVPGVGELEVTIVDAANPLVFVRWTDLGLTGTESPADIDGDPALLARIESVRAHAGVLAGIASSAAEATTLTPSVPKMTFVGRPLAYVSGAGLPIDEASFDLRVGMMSMGRVHPSIALTGAICTAVASGLPGTIVAHATADRSPAGMIRLGHNGGVMQMEAAPQRTADGGWRIDSVSAYRTARRLLTGTVQVSDAKVATLSGELQDMAEG